MAETSVWRRLRHQHVCPADLVREYYAGDVPLEDIHHLFDGCVVAFASSIENSLTSAAVLNYRYTLRKEMSAGSSGHLDGTTVSSSLFTSVSLTVAEGEHIRSAGQVAASHAESPGRDTCRDCGPAQREWGRAGELAKTVRPAEVSPTRPRTTRRD